MSDLNFEQQLIDAIKSVQQLSKINSRDNSVILKAINSSLSSLLKTEVISLPQYNRVKWLFAQLNKKIYNELNETELQGVTGESNLLSYQSKGLVYLELNASCPFEDSFVLLTIALLTGNSCMINKADNVITLFCRLLSGHLPAGLLTVIEDKYQQLLLTHPAIKLVVSCAAKKRQIEINRHLAGKTTAITALIALPATTPLANLNRKELLLRFVNERCVCNNITAVGGNTQLLTMF